MITLHYMTDRVLDLSAVPEGWERYIRSEEDGGIYHIEIDVEPSEGSYVQRALMEISSALLEFELPYWVELPYGTWIEWRGRVYTLRQPAAVTKNGSRSFAYSLPMEGHDGLMRIYKFRAPDTTERVKWSLTGKPRVFAEAICRAMNALETGVTWEAGECFDRDEVAVELSHVYFSEAIQNIADAFEGEWEVSCRGARAVVSFMEKIEHGKADAGKPSLSYGRGNGFIPGVGRTIEDADLPIGRLYVQGAERNIDRSTYWKRFGFPARTQYLRLPVPRRDAAGNVVGATLEYNGAEFRDQAVGGSGYRTYTTDARGLYIERLSPAKDSVREDSIDAPDKIYPHKELTVTGVLKERNNGTEADGDKRAEWLYKVYTEANDIDYSKLLIEGAEARITFQTGMLAGKSFSFTYIHNPTYQTDGTLIEAGRRFVIVQQELDNQWMPNETYAPAVGDKLAVFGVRLPDEYIDAAVAGCDEQNAELTGGADVFYGDNGRREGAAWDMFREGVKKLWEREQRKFSFTGELQPLWVRRHWAALEGYLAPGYYVSFSDEQIQAAALPIRIKTVKEPLARPYAVTIELSNAGAAVSPVRELERKYRHLDAIATTPYDNQRIVEIVKSYITSSQGELDGLKPRTITISQQAALMDGEAWSSPYIALREWHKADGSVRRVYTVDWRGGDEVTIACRLGATYGSGAVELVPVLIRGLRASMSASYSEAYRTELRQQIGKSVTFRNATNGAYAVHGDVASADGAFTADGSLTLGTGRFMRFTCCVRTVSVGGKDLEEIYWTVLEGDMSDGTQSVSEE